MNCRSSRSSRSGRRTRNSRNSRSGRRTLRAILLGIPLVEGDALVDVGVVFGVAAEAEECRFGVVLGQVVEHPFGDVGRWPVVEGEKKSLICTVNFPFEVGHQVANELRRMVYYSNHKCRFLRGAKLTQTKTENTNTDQERKQNLKPHKT